jgi:hypothetical protein
VSLIFAENLSSPWFLHGTEQKTTANGFGDTGHVAALEATADGRVRVNFV